MRPVVRVVPVPPAPDRPLMGAQLLRQFGDRGRARLDIRPRPRRRRRVRVQLHIHRKRRSCAKATPRSTPIPSRQSSDTQHLGRGQHREAMRVRGNNSFAGEHLASRRPPTTSLLRSFRARLRSARGRRRPASARGLCPARPCSAIPSSRATTNPAGGWRPLSIRRSRREAPR